MAAGALLLVADALDERSDIFGSPYSCTGAELDRFGETAGAASLPPGAFADGENGKNLGQTEKAGSRDCGLILMHKKPRAVERTKKELPWTLESKELWGSLKFEARGFLGC